MTESLYQIANLTGHVCAFVRLSFGAIPLMTPRRVLAMSRDVGVVILDHVGRLHDVRELRDEDGNLRIPARDASQPSIEFRARKLVTLGHNDEVTVSILPDGPSISIVVSDLEPGHQRPEIDIKLPHDMILNCYGAGLRPARETAHGPSVLEGRQIIIPIEGPHASPRPAPHPGVGTDA